MLYMITEDYRDGDPQTLPSGSAPALSFARKPRERQPVAAARYSESVRDAHGPEA